MCENCSRVRFGAHVRMLHERLDVSHDQKHSYRRLCCLHCVAAAVLRFLNNSKGFQNILSAVRTDAILWNTFLLIRHSSALNKTCLQWKGAQVIIPNWLKMVYISLFLFAITRILVILIFDYTYHRRWDLHRERNPTPNWWFCIVAPCLSDRWSGNFCM